MTIGANGKVTNTDKVAKKIYEYLNYNILNKNITKNNDGIVSGITDTSIIDCQPVDENGMLLIDKELGLGQTGITQTSSAAAMTDKYLKGPVGQTVIGFLLLLLTTNLLRSTYNIIK